MSGCGQDAVSGWAGMVSMPAECTTCTHARIADIHRMLDAGEGVNATARAFRIPPSTLKLHLKHRKPPAPLAQAAGAEPELGELDAGELPLADLETRFQQAATTADRLRRVAESAEVPLRERTSALGECRRTIETMVKLAERINERRETDILQSPQWAVVLDVMLKALEPFTEARAALTEALRQHERS